MKNPDNTTDSIRTQKPTTCSNLDMDEHVIIHRHSFITMINQYLQVCAECRTDNLQLSLKNEITWRQHFAYHATHVAAKNKLWRNRFNAVITHNLQQQVDQKQKRANAKQNHNNFAVKNQSIQR